MQYILNIITYIFDAFILSTFLNATQGKVNPKYKIHYLFALFFSELTIYANELLISNYGLPSFVSSFATAFISIMTTFVLCLFFDSSLKQKILAIFSFQFLATFGEWMFSALILLIYPDILSVDSTSMIYSVMNIGSKVVLFFLCLLVHISFRKRSHDVTAEYTMLLLTTPIITCFLFASSLPYIITDEQACSHGRILLICMIVLNIMNYILIQQAQSSAHAIYSNRGLQQQLNFQKDKYRQLCEAYRQNRRVIHDMKKHYFLIQEYIRDGRYSELIDYTSTAITDIENTYAKYNTGNLVIDSLLTNYDNLSANGGITFNARLNVDFNRIPTDDYDLCVILGNILDNALNACNSDDCSKPYIHISIETTDNDKFLIHCENSASADDKCSKEQPVNHGIGLRNVQITVENGFGLFSCEHIDDIFYTDIMIPIIDESKRLHG